MKRQVHLGRTYLIQRPQGAKGWTADEIFTPESVVPRRVRHAETPRGPGARVRGLPVVRARPAIGP